MRPSGAHTHPEMGGGPGPAALAGMVILGGVAGAVIGAAEWVAARIWWVIGGTLVLAVLAVAAVLGLKYWSDRRAAAVFAAREPLKPAAPPVTEAPTADLLRTVPWQDEARKNASLN